AGGGTALCCRISNMLLDAVDALNEDLVTGGVRLDDVALCTLVRAGDDQHGIALADLQLNHLRCERHDLHELLVTQLTGNGPEDAGAARLAVRLDDDGCVLVEAN